MRTPLTTDTLFWVDGTNGDDTNTGTESNPWKTVTRGLGHICNELDLQAKATLALKSGTYDPISVGDYVSGDLAQDKLPTIMGDPNAPVGAVSITGEFPLFVGMHTSKHWRFGRMALHGSGACVYCDAGAYAFVFDLNMTGNIAMNATLGGRVKCVGDVTLSGTFSTGIAATLGGHFHFQSAHNLILSGNPDFTGRLLRADGGTIAMSRSGANQIFAGSCTGKKWESVNNGAIFLKGTVVPGTVAGTNDTSSAVAL